MSDVTQVIIEGGDIHVVVETSEIQVISVGEAAPVAQAGAAVWGLITGTLSTQTDLQAALNAKEPANTNIQAHISSTSNPHATTALQVGADVSGAAATAQAFAIQRVNHTGTQSADTIVDGTANKVFTAADAVLLSQQSGTNTGNVTLSAAGNTPSANGASIAGQVLTLQPASNTYPGLAPAAGAGAGGKYLYFNPTSGRYEPHLVTQAVTVNMVANTGAFTVDDSGEYIVDVLGLLTGIGALNVTVVNAGTPFTFFVDNQTTGSTMYLNGDPLLLIPADTSIWYYDGALFENVYGINLVVPVSRTVNGHGLSSNVVVTAADIGLGNVDNTSDATKNAATVSLTNHTIATTSNTITIGADQSFGGHKITNMADPSAAQDGATKNYVDNNSAGLKNKTQAGVTVATIAALPAYTYANGTLGVGATITANAVGILTVDSHQVLLNEYVLLKNGAAASDDGYYKCTTEGTAGVAAVLTRDTGMDLPSEFLGAYVFANTGATLANTGWNNTTTVVTIGTDPVAFQQFSASSTITPGTNITVVGTTVSVDTGIPRKTDNLSVMAATTSAQLAGVLSDETGTGVAVFNINPTLVGQTITDKTVVNMEGVYSKQALDLSHFYRFTGSTLTTGDLYTLLGELCMDGWAHNTYIDGAGNFVGRENTGSCELCVFTESGLFKYYSAATASTGVVPVWVLKQTLNIVTGDLTIAGAFSSGSLTTPTIASFVNATHTHLNAAGGGLLSNAAVNASMYSGGGAASVGPLTTADIQTDLRSRGVLAVDGFGIVTANGTTAVDVAAGRFALRTTNSKLASLENFTTAAVTNHSIASLLATGDVYVYFTYATGAAPQYSNTDPDPADTDQTVLKLAEVHANTGGTAISTIHDVREFVGNTPGQFTELHRSVFGVLVGGQVTTITGGAALNLGISSGTFFSPGSNNHSISALDTSISGSFTLWYHSASAWVSTSGSSFTGSISGTTLTVTGSPVGLIAIGQLIAGAAANTMITDVGTGTGGAGTYVVSINQSLPGSNALTSTQVALNNKQYDNGTDLTSLGGSKYGVQYQYRDTNGAVHVVMGQGNYTSAALAGAAVVPALPAVLTQAEHCYLMSSTVIQLSATSGVVNDLANRFNASNMSQSLAGYALLAGANFSGAVTAPSFNGNTITTGTGTIALAASSSLITSGAFALTLTSTATTNATLPAGTHTLAALDVVQAFTKTQTATPVSLTSTSASIAVDLSLSNNFSHTMTENTTLAAPSNAVAGTSGQIAFTQHASAAKTLAFNAAWISADGATPVISTAVGTVNLLTYYVVDSTHIWFALNKHGVT